ncbi:MAG: NAD(P)/FAD-dependent oxidoreductase [Proteobacteria bacterium]|nr:NAD(P)/FAD-dependent oxidoreductase [Pseudomonadota bacterium]
MAIRLKRAGFGDFTLLERAESVGGTWRDNVYPGCACDIPSHLYSFSFELNPHWSRMYPPQEEIRKYLEDCARKYQVLPQVVFGAEVSEARFDEEAKLWSVRTADGRRFEAEVLVNASGPLSRPLEPDLPGLEEFRGEVFHSARWEPGFDPRGRDVAVIGTGASAIQIVPELAPLARRLTVFQRTPPWIVPKGDRAFEDAERRRLARWPWLRRWRRYRIWLRQESLAPGFLGHGGCMRGGERMARLHLRSQVADPELRRTLTPDYPLGCKRVLISDDYYPALQRDNVELVSAGIERATGRGLLDRQGREHPADAIVLGTGFAATEFLAPMKVFGRGGAELGERWRSGAEAYLGIAVADFPNFFLLVGPNTGLGHNSVVLMIEAQVHFVLRCLERLRGERGRSIEILPEAQRAFAERLQGRMRGTVWLSGCQSWYLSPDGSNWTLWPGYTFEYWWRTRRPDPAAFALA